MKRFRTISGVPALILMIVILLPAAGMIGNMFLDNGNLNFSPLSKALVSIRQAGLLKNTVIIALATCLICITGAITLNLFIFRTAPKGGKVLANAMILPILIPPFVHALAWEEGFRLLSEFCAHRLEFQMPDIHSIWGVVLVLTISYFPIAFLILRTGLTSMDRTLEEAALQSSSQWKTIKSISIPLLMPNICAATTFIMAMTLLNFEVADILRVRIYPMEIFIQFSAFYDERGAIALAIPIVLICLAGIIAMHRYMGNRSYTSLGGHASTREPCFRISKCMTLSGWLVSFAYLIPALLYPVTLIFLSSGGLNAITETFAMACNDILYSLLIAMASTLLITGASIPIARFITRGGGILPLIMDYATLIPLGLPGIIIGIGAIRIFNRPCLDWFYGTWALLALSLTSAGFPIVMRITVAQMRTIPCEYEETAMLARPERFCTFRRILLPLMMPAIWVSLAAGFILSLTNLSTSLLTAPPGKSMLPVTIYNLMHYGVREKVFSLCAIMISISGIIALITWFAMGRSIRAASSSHHNILPAGNPSGIDTSKNDSAENKFSGDIQ
ncbi:MAG: hypothetical protein CVV64_10310 [Candidatus Wallbacteria bacterium HGW-Wallbacteria-1]|jgi:iron(III) transport system permease protein|uniref:ABC transmembrane type-1 domain-containing protein n=1 Tax=Candidatus Wallbacteria bacterium HGW-Wallbacteria-1 TaxID=2013854 RepID=A0A2N1PPS9_9BACT|nr:MAG: hypothetical protein CVV64_10310 [Candidatus Wallbacteria bacterium HGW-Wallbacteria-1]